MVSEQEAVPEMCYAAENDPVQAVEDLANTIVPVAGMCLVFATDQDQVGLETLVARQVDAAMVQPAEVDAGHYVALLDMGCSGSAAIHSLELAAAQVEMLVVFVGTPAVELADMEVVVVVAAAAAARRIGVPDEAAEVVR